MMSQQQQQQQPTTNISPMPNTGQIIMHNPLQQQQHHHQQITPQSPQVPMLPQLDVLSVSSKKICSYCNRELGSGAAMIIENLGLFYHIDCFKCTVCQTQIADGNIHGTDVRVRNSRLHCANCFSNEEGIKFSCVWLTWFFMLLVCSFFCLFFFCSLWEKQKKIVIWEEEKELKI